MRWMAILLALAAAGASADTCVFFDSWSVRSPNGEWRLVVSGGHATLLESNKPRVHWRLVNESTVGPGGALLANDGTAVTFGNGCSEGPSASDVVIYRPDGKLVRSLGMRDFLVAEDISLLRHWAGQHRIDEDKKQIVLEVKGPPHGFSMPISLESGEMLAPVRRRFYVPEYQYSVAVDPAVRCADSAQLLAQPVEQELPAYPPVAQKARITGDVIVEVRVDAAGAIDAVRFIKPLPFGLDRAVEEAARHWRFAPPGRPACGRFVTHFDRQQLPPPAID